MRDVSRRNNLANQCGGGFIQIVCDFSMPHHDIAFYAECLLTDINTSSLVFYGRRSCPCGSGAQGYTLVSGSTILMLRELNSFRG